jgi:hypothetical protein
VRGRWTPSSRSSSTGLRPTARGPLTDEGGGSRVGRLFLALALLLLGLGVFVALAFDEEETLVSTARHFLRNLLRALF